MQSSFTISMPLSVQVGTRTSCATYIINMNNSAMKHRHAYNNVKKRYTEIALLRLAEFRNSHFKKCRLIFRYFKKDKRSGDRANVLNYHEKFFCDALTKSCIIEDDNDSIIESTIYLSGGLDKENPRVEITVEEVE